MPAGSSTSPLPSLALCQRLLQAGAGKRFSNAASAASDVIGSAGVRSWSSERELSLEPPGCEPASTSGTNASARLRQAGVGAQVGRAAVLLGQPLQAGLLLPVPQLSRQAASYCSSFALSNEGASAELGLTPLAAAWRALACQPGHAGDAGACDVYERTCLLLDEQGLHSGASPPAEAARQFASIAESLAALAHAHAQPSGDVLRSVNAAFPHAVASADTPELLSLVHSAKSLGWLVRGPISDAIYGRALDALPTLSAADALALLHVLVPAQYEGQLSMLTLLKGLQLRVQHALQHSCPPSSQQLTPAPQGGRLFPQHQQQQLPQKWAAPGPPRAPPAAGLQLGRENLTDVVSLLCLLAQHAGQRNAAGAGAGLAVTGRARGGYGIAASLFRAAGDWLEPHLLSLTPHQAARLAAAYAAAGSEAHHPRLLAGLQRAAESALPAFGQEDLTLLAHAFSALKDPVPGVVRAAAQHLGAHLPGVQAAHVLDTAASLARVGAREQRFVDAACHHAISNTLLQPLPPLQPLHAPPCGASPSSSSSSSCSTSASVIDLARARAGLDPRTSIAITGLPCTLKPQELLELVKPAAGPGLDLFHLPFDYARGRGPGTAYLNLCSPQALADAAEALQGAVLSHRRPQQPAGQAHGGRGQPRGGGGGGGAHGASPPRQPPRAQEAQDVVLRLEYSPVQGMDQLLQLFRAAADSAGSSACSWPTLFYTCGSLQGLVQPLEEQQLTLRALDRRSDPAAASAAAAEGTGQSRQQYFGLRELVHLAGSARAVQAPHAALQAHLAQCVVSQAQAQAQAHAQAQASSTTAAAAAPGAHHHHGQCQQRQRGGGSRAVLLPQLDINTSLLGITVLTEAHQSLHPPSDSRYPHPDSHSHPHTDHHFHHHHQQQQQQHDTTQQGLQAPLPHAVQLLTQHAAVLLQYEVGRQGGGHHLQRQRRQQQQQQQPQQRWDPRGRSPSPRRSQRDNWEEETAKQLASALSALAAAATTTMASGAAEGAAAGAAGGPGSGQLNGATQQLCAAALRFVEAGLAARTLRLRRLADLLVPLTTLAPLGLPALLRGEVAASLLHTLQQQPHRVSGGVLAACAWSYARTRVVVPGLLDAFAAHILLHRQSPSSSPSPLLLPMADLSASQGARLFWSLAEMGHAQQSEYEALLEHLLGCYCFSPEDLLLLQEGLALASSAVQRRQQQQQQQQQRNQAAVQPGQGGGVVHAEGAPLSMPLFLQQLVDTAAKSGPHPRSDRQSVQGGHAHAHAHTNAHEHQPQRSAATGAAATVSSSPQQPHQLHDQHPHAPAPVSLEGPHLSKLSPPSQLSELGAPVAVVSAAVPPTLAQLLGAVLAAHKGAYVEHLRQVRSLALPHGLEAKVHSVLGALRSR